VAFATTGFACPPSADNFIYGFTPIELRQNIKALWAKNNERLSNCSLFIYYFTCYFVYNTIYERSIKVIYNKDLNRVLEIQMAKPRRRRKIGSKKRRAKWKIRHKIS